jgi:hypothetical protein
MGSFFYWYSLCHSDRKYPLKCISVINRDGWLDEVPGEFYPVCGFFLFDSLCSAKNFPYRIFRFLARIKKSCAEMIFKKPEHSQGFYPAASASQTASQKKHSLQKRYHVIIVFIAGAKREDRYIHSLTFITGYCIF